MSEIRVSGSSQQAVCPRRIGDLPMSVQQPNTPQQKPVLRASFGTRMSTGVKLLGTITGGLVCLARLVFVEYFVITKLNRYIIVSAVCIASCSGISLLAQQDATQSQQSSDNTK